MGIIILIGAGVVAVFILCITSKPKIKIMTIKEEEEYEINA
jgi:hypothetical protein